MLKEFHPTQGKRKVQPDPESRARGSNLKWINYEFRNSDSRALAMQVRRDTWPVAGMAGQDDGFESKE